MMKIAKTTSSCRSCPFQSYYSGRAYKCNKTDENILDMDKVAAFCPLPDFPSAKLAEQEINILALRNGFEKNPIIALFTSICVKCNLSLSTRGHIRLKLKSGMGEDLSDVYIMPERVKKFDMQTWQIDFIYSDDEYQFSFGVKKGG